MSNLPNSKEFLKAKTEEFKEEKFKDIEEEDN